MSQYGCKSSRNSLWFTSKTSVYSSLPFLLYSPLSFSNYRENLFILQLREWETILHFSLTNSAIKVIPVVCISANSEIINYIKYCLGKTQQKLYSQEHNSFQYCYFNDWNVHMWFLIILKEVWCKAIIKSKYIFFIK